MRRLRRDPTKCSVGLYRIIKGFPASSSRLPFHALLFMALNLVVSYSSNTRIKHERTFTYLTMLLLYIGFFAFIIESDKTLKTVVSR